MRIVYLGSPKEAVIPLEALFSRQKEWDCELVGVVSQPARPAGRNRQMTDPPVAAFAKSKGIPTLQPEKARSPDFLDSFRALQPDIAITAAYGQILSDDFLAIPRRATMNIHPSLLPRYRGATPVPAALLAGDQTTGVTILFTVKALDAGNIILQKEHDVLQNETADRLTERMFREGGELLGDAIRALRDPKFVGQPQDPSAVTFCKKIQKEDGQINWSLSADEILNRFRAYFPWPGSYSALGDKGIVFNRILARTSADGPNLGPGEFTFYKPDRCLLVGTGSTSIAVERLTPASGKEQDAAAFWNSTGQKLDSKVFGKKS